MTVKVVVIDDSAMVRRVLSDVLGGEPDIEVVGAAPDPFAGRDLIVEHDPDVVLLDMEMPRMDGLTFLTKLMNARPIPVVVVSSLTTDGSALALEALRRGAIEVVSKPNVSYSLGEMAARLPSIVRAAASAQPGAVEPETNPLAAYAPLVGVDATNKVVGVGASTGGTIAIERLLVSLGPRAPGMVIVQHIPAAFGLSFADRLDRVTDVEVRVAEDGDVIKHGTALLAPGGRHTVVRRSGALYGVQLVDEPIDTRHRPSVDVLFDSIASSAGPNAMGVLLTGMGVDGAEGLLQMRNAGARTVAQDERSCVVYGMPRAANERGAADVMLPLGSMAAAIADFASGRPLVRAGQAL